MATRLKLGSMAVLIVISLVFAFALGNSWQWMVFLALCFSWVGDAFMAKFEPLARRVPDPFLAGMGAFALAQIAYCIAFGQSLSGMPRLHMRVPGAYLGAELLPLILPVYLLVGLFAWVFIVMRTKHPWDFKAVTLVYCLLLCLMAGFAACAAFTGVRVVWPLIVGGLLFLISDGCIAARVFRDALPGERRYEAAVWGTYLPAQILLLLGTSWLH